MIDQILRYLESLRGWLDVHPALGVLLFVGIFVAVQVCLLPLSPFGMASGFFFGFWKGFVALMLGCALGATLNFLLVRWIARDFVRRKLSGNDKFRTIEVAVQREGWRIIALSRFVPIPFGLANYGYGLTPIPYVPYILATCLAIIPANSVFVWLGCTCKGAVSTLLTGRQHQPVEYVFLALGLVAAVLALRMVARAARSAVERSAEQSQP